MIVIFRFRKAGLHCEQTDSMLLSMAGYFLHEACFVHTDARSMVHPCQLSLYHKLIEHEDLMSPLRLQHADPIHTGGTYYAASRGNDWNVNHTGLEANTTQGKMRAYFGASE